MLHLGLRQTVSGRSMQRFGGMMRSNLIVVGRFDSCNRFKIVNRREQISR